MFNKLLAGGALAATLLAVAPRTQSTPAPMAAAYGSLADTILAVKSTEANLVRTLLDGHYRAAAAHVRGGDYQKAAAEMALYANEGDNAIGGVRKRLLAGGHHHNADGEAKGVYEPGYVIVTREAKEAALALSAQMRAVTDADAAKGVWAEFELLSKKLLKAD